MLFMGLYTFRAAEHEPRGLCQDEMRIKLTPELNR